MPELPEVETIRRGLADLLPGKTVASIWHDWAKSFPNADSDVQQFLMGAQITEIKRRAKVLLIELDSKYTLVIHLKMTGQLVYVQQATGNNQHKISKSIDHKVAASKDEIRFGAGHPSTSLVNELPDKSTRVVLCLQKKYVAHGTGADHCDAHLYFNDQRKFGWMRLLPTAEVPNIDFFKKVGPEPLASDFTVKAFNERLKRRQNTNIKAALLDQTVVAGVGNIYADESLWAAKIHPKTLVRNVSTPKMNTLFKELQAVLHLSIEKGGSTDKNYVDASGNRGSYLNFANVFRREGKPCSRHPDTLIQKIRVAGRGTHICPRCQKDLNK